MLKSYRYHTDEDGVEMKDLRKVMEDNYLTFITIAAGSVALIAVIVWIITFFVKKVKNNSSTIKS